MRVTASACWYDLQRLFRCNLAVLRTYPEFENTCELRLTLRALHRSDPIGVNLRKITSGGFHHYRYDDNPTRNLSTRLHVTLRNSEGLDVNGVATRLKHPRPLKSRAWLGSPQRFQAEIC